MESVEILGGESLWGVLADLHLGLGDHHVALQKLSMFLPNLKYLKLTQSLPDLFHPC